MALAALVKKVIGSRNDRIIKRLRKQVIAINRLEATMEALSDAELTHKTTEFKARLTAGESLNSLLPEAFAAVREASKRTLGLRHFDVQLIGGMVLHEGNIAEMLTGEGKTLVATLPAYLNALTERGVHIVTVNDYLAKRDAAWMRPVYELLGLTVGVNVPGMDQAEKQLAYQADIVYGTNNEFGFDYLRDNMAFSLADKVQRDLYFAIVDEVDSILIDEARTPLIISGQADDSSELYQKLNQLIPKLKVSTSEAEPDGDYTLDEKTKQAYLTEQGHQRVEEMLATAGILPNHASLYDAEQVTILHYLAACLRAHTLFHRDVDYIVKDNEIVIVDEHTGRLMVGRRWSDGLHQAIEAKEKVAIQTENQTLASITFQNYFRLYEKLAGMTGTADTEAYEFHQIYGLEVVVIPPNRKVVRKDYADKVYLNANAKFKAVLEEIKECRERMQPVLVGTTSIETSELISKLLNQENIPHEVLNAKQHEREAHVIAQAGKPGAVTIATNMAGRGTDIVLGGNIEAELQDLGDIDAATKQQHYDAWLKRQEEVKAAGGLHVLGTERHESRRIDNQLRGRSGRQGDPGSSRFYLGLDDNLLRIFASERLAALMNRLGVNEEDAMESSMLTKVIENAQRKVEGHNFDMRKQLLEFDNVANDQRRVIYKQRADILAEDNVSDILEAIIVDVADLVTQSYVPKESFSEQWDLVGLSQCLLSEFNLDLDMTQLVAEHPAWTEQDIRHEVLTMLQGRYQLQQQTIGTELFRQIEKSILLSTVDTLWKEHLAAMDHLRLGIHLRGYAQKNPKQEYKREAFELFSRFLDTLRRQVVSAVCRVQLAAPQAADMQQAPLLSPNLPVDSQNIGRNDPCYCGSGKKYKHCHGSLQ